MLQQHARAEAIRYTVPSVCLREVAMRSVVIWKILALATLGAIVACSADSGDDVFGTTQAKGGSAGAAGQTGTGGAVMPQGGAPGQGGGMLIDADVGGDGPPPTGCNVPKNDPSDNDKDGWSALDGDCNDCDALINPGAFDDASPSADGGAPVDTNCDGQPGGDTYECDDGLQIADNDAFNAAKAIGLCRKADAAATGKDKTWGVLDARFVKADGTPGMKELSHGILPQFGQNGNVQAGKTMLALSSGTARGPAMPGYQSPQGAQMGTKCNPPIPDMDTPACPGVETGDPNDPAALEVMIRVPTNAKSFKFNLNFYTFEFPGYICSQFNDFFVTLMTPKPSGSSDGNISFDQDNNPISVNNSMLRACSAQSAGGKNFTCPLGTALLQGTGFEGHAATGWLQTISPVEPGTTVKLRFAIWDSGDQILDSTVLVDNFAFSVEPASGTVTEPIPDPK